MAVGFVQTATIRAPQKRNNDRATFRESHSTVRDGETASKADADAQGRGEVPAGAPEAT